MLHFIYIIKILTDYLFYVITDSKVQDASKNLYAFKIGKITVIINM